MIQIEQTITSVEVAEMVNKRHADLIRDVRRYIEQLNENNIAFVEFFTESTYKDSKGETRPCYNVTKKGCEFIAHKLTGAKGTEFTARYINRFHDKVMIYKPTGSTYAPANEGKIVIDKNLEYNGAPDRGAFYFERMKRAHEKDILKGAQEVTKKA